MSYDETLSPSFPGPPPAGPAPARRRWVIPALVVAVALVGLAQLPEGRRVEVEPLDPHPHLVVVEVRCRIEAPRRLGQHASGLEHPVQPDR